MGLFPCICVVFDSLVEFMWEFERLIDEIEARAGRDEGDARSWLRITASERALPRSVIPIPVTGRVARRDEMFSNLTRLTASSLRIRDDRLQPPFAGMSRHHSDEGESSDSG